MADIVTLAEAKAYCRIDHADDDSVLALLITSASDTVREIATDWPGTGTTPDRIKLAVLSRVAITYDERDSVEGAKGELSMLTPLRKLEV